MVTCSFCGDVTADAVPPLNWALSLEQGRTKYFCEGCSREHLRSIESKLDSEWW